MTTTTDKMRNRVISLMERARHKDTPLLEANACREKAQQLVTKYELAPSLLTDLAPIRPSAARGPATPYVEKTYPCRFGCGVFIQHTADEMGACAERRRAETGRDSAYEQAGDTMSFTFGGNFNAGTGWTGAGHREHVSYTSHKQRQREKTEQFRRMYGMADDEPHTGSESAADEPKPRRRQTSHAHCDHEPTKAARARCRKEGGPMY